MSIIKNSIQNENKRISMKNLASKIMSNPEVGIIIPLFVIIIITGILKPNFFSENNISAILRSIAFIGISAIGETLVILVGEIDISFGSVAGLGSILSTYFMTHGTGVFLSIIFAVVICAVIGLINGVIVSYLRISAFITTIGMMYIARGILMVITKGYPIYPLPESMNQFGSAEPLRTSWSFIIFIILIIAFDILLRKTVYGRQVYAVGDNRDVAKLVGINVSWVKISAFIAAAVLSCIAGILLSAQLHAGTPSIGFGWELQAIAATAIGGISLTGGSGSMIGTLIGLIILAVLNNSLVLLGIDTQVQTIMVGVVMISAVTLDMLKRNKKLSG